MNYTKEENDHLYSRLVKLGDMIGDGLHLEPDGKWIEKEYKQTIRLLGLLPKKKTKSIDDFMAKRTAIVKCDCGEGLKQVRKGSFVAKCTRCGNKYRLGNKQRKGE